MTRTENRGSLDYGPVEKHSQDGSAELQIPPLRFASVGMTRGVRKFRGERLLKRGRGAAPTALNHDDFDTQPFRAGLTFGGRPSGPRLCVRKWRTCGSRWRECCDWWSDEDGKPHPRSYHAASRSIHWLRLLSPVTEAQAFPAGIGGPSAIHHQGMTVHKSAVRWIS